MIFLCNPLIAFDRRERDGVDGRIEWIGGEIKYFCILLRGRIGAAFLPTLARNWLLDNWVVAPHPRWSSRLYRRMMMMMMMMMMKMLPCHSADSIVLYLSKGYH